MPIYKITNFSSTQDLTKKQPQREQHHQQQQQQQQQQHQPQTQNQLQQFNHLDNSQRKPTSNEISTNQNTNNINLSNKSSTTNNNNNNNSNYNTKNTNTNKSNSNIRNSSSSKTSFDHHQPIINKNGDVTFYFEKVVDTTPRSSFSSPSLSSSNSYSNFIKANLHPQQQKHSMEESIIEKEIRLQMERELEIRSLKNNSLNRASNNPTPINSISSNSIFSHNNNNNGGLYQHKRSDSMSLAGSDISNNTATTNTASSGSYYTPEEDVNGNSTISRYVREQNGNLHYKNDNINNINDKNINGSHKNTVDHDFTDNVDNHSSPKSDENGTNKMNYQKRSLVQPFADEDDDDDPRFKFIQPQQESVIEKEVRLTRQREGSLRRARGYPLVTHTNELESVVEIPLFDPSTNNEDNDTFSNKICNNNCTKNLSNQKLDECDKYVQESGARRFATNRLKQEILKERQREIDLRRLGKINTLSSERVALDAKTLEELASKRSTSELNIREASNSHVNQKELTSVRDVARPMKKTLTIVNNNDSSCSNVNSETTGGHNDEDVVDNDNIAEWRIEEEILESKRREEELREQRKNLGLQVNTLKPRTNPTFVSSYRRI